MGSFSSKTGHPAKCCDLDRHETTRATDDGTSKGPAPGPAPTLRFPEHPTCLSHQDGRPRPRISGVRSVDRVRGPGKFQFSPATKPAQPVYGPAVIPLHVQSEFQRARSRMCFGRSRQRRQPVLDVRLTVTFWKVREELSKEERIASVLQRINADGRLKKKNLWIRRAHRVNFKKKANLRAILLFCLLIPLLGGPIFNTRAPPTNSPRKMFLLRKSLACYDGGKNARRRVAR